MSHSGLFAEVEYVKLHPDAQEPHRTHEADAGNDLKALEDFTMYPGQTKLVKTGVALAVPNHCVGLVQTRSSTAKIGIFVTGGVIDHGYTGECGVVLNNLGDEKVNYRKGDKIAQIVFLPIIEATFKQVESLGTTSRGTGGFGSTGK